MPRVLVVDDDPMVCTAIEVCLMRRSFEVTVADGGEAGMRAPAPSDFDAMPIDALMPHIARLRTGHAVDRPQSMPHQADRFRTPLEMK